MELSKKALHNKIARISGVSVSSVNRYCNNIHVKDDTRKLIEDGIRKLGLDGTINEPISKPDNTTGSSKGSKKAVCEKSDTLKIKSIGEERDIFKIFEILNSNIEALHNELEHMKNSAEKSKKDTADKKQIEVHVFCKRTDLQSIEYEEYKEQIKKCIKAISAFNDIPVKELYCYYYKVMNMVYGVVYKQMSQEYKETHGDKAESSLELIYDNKIFREVMYNIVLDDVCRASDNTKIKWLI